MSTNRMSRVNELLQREIASALYRLNTDGKLDLAKVTVSHVITSPDLRKCRVLVSVLGAREEGMDVIRLLNRKRKDLQHMVSSVVVLKYTPHLQFFLDESIASGNEVLEIMDQLPPMAEDEEDSDGPKP